jgi:diguanylate cyclase (GGDEF)-like protein
MIDWRALPEALLTSLAAGFNGAFALYIFRRTTSAARLFACLFVSICIWCTFQTLELLAQPIATKILFAKLQYLGIVSIPVLWLLFAYAFAHANHKPSRSHTALLWFVPVLTLALVVTNEWHGWVWSAITPHTAPLDYHLIFAKGGWFWVFTAYSYTLLLIGLYHFIRGLSGTGNTYIRQLVVVFMAVGIPWLGNIIYLTNWEPLRGLDLTPLCFTFSAILGGWVLFRDSLVDFVPITRDLVMEQAGEALLVLDNKNRILDINTTARGMLNLSAQVVGQPLEYALRHRPDWLHCFQSTGAQSEVIITDQPVRYLDLRVTPLRDAQHKVIGRLIVLHNVTALRVVMQELQSVNTELQSQLQLTTELQELLQEQANRDALTGLYNRRYLMDALEDNAGSTWETCSLVMIDMDHFKEINDQWGHRAGDTILKEFATLLNASIPENAFACRYGGEEFLVVLPNIPEYTAAWLANQWREEFAHKRILKDEPHLRFTFSAGVASLRSPHLSLDEVLTEADHALYRAKSGGRNKVVAASEPALRARTGTR